MTRLVPVLVVALTLALGAFAGTAYAYFTASGTGSSHATMGNRQTVVVEQATVVSGDLIPGGKAGLALKLTNPGDFAVKLVGVSEAGVGTTVTVTPATASCTGSGSGVSVSPTVATGLSGYTIKAHATGATTLTVATGAAMSSSAPSGCQTKSFHIKVTVTVQT